MLLGVTVEGSRGCHNYTTTETPSDFIKEAYTLFLACVVTITLTNINHLEKDVWTSREGGYKFLLGWVQCLISNPNRRQRLQTKRLHLCPSVCPPAIWSVA